MSFPGRALLVGTASAAALAFTAVPALTQVSNSAGAAGGSSSQTQRLVPKLSTLCPCGYENLEGKCTPRRHIQTTRRIQTTRDRPHECPAPAPEKLANPELTGFQLVQRFENNLAPDRGAQLARFLSGAFIIRRSDGSTLNRAQYLQNHPFFPGRQLKVFEAEYAAPVLTVSAVAWSLPATSYAPGLFSFAWINGGWKMTAFAKFPDQATLPAG